MELIGVVGDCSDGELGQATKVKVNLLLGSFLKGCFGENRCPSIPVDLTGMGFGYGGWLKPLGICSNKKDAPYIKFVSRS